MQRPDPDEGRERARALSDYGAGRGPRLARARAATGTVYGLRSGAMGYWVARRGSGAGCGANRESKEGRARREGHL